MPGVAPCRGVISARGVGTRAILGRRALICPSVAGVGGVIDRRCGCAVITPRRRTRRIGRRGRGRTGGPPERRYVGLGLSL